MVKQRSTPRAVDHGLELLLGLSYSFTLHDQFNRRLIGFDNAHAVKPLGRAAKRPKAFDHWHTTAIDKGRPYDFSDAATLVEDFFDACERYLASKGITLQGTGDDSPRSGEDS